MHEIEDENAELLWNPFIRCISKCVRELKW